MVENEVINAGEHMMTVCNSCRYCEGFCAVWRAMEFRRNFSEGDLNYLANLCHDCSECYYACQYAPPHEWAINPPLTFAKLRGRFYEQHSWPGMFTSAFRANGIVFSLITALTLILFLFGVVYFRESKILLTPVSNGNFYQIIPHGIMITVFGVAGLLSILSLVISFSRFTRNIDEKVRNLFNLPTLITTVNEVLRLKYLDGGGWGCAYPGEVSSSLRRWFHHFTFYGFLLCFAATTVGFIYHYLFGWHAPHEFISLPVILGLLGGIGLLIGPAGLLALKLRRNREITDNNQCEIDSSFHMLLLLTSASGLLLLFLRETWLIGSLLVIHLGLAMSLIITLPYGKFVHGIYRFLAIAKYQRECKHKQTIGAA